MKNAAQAGDGTAPKAYSSVASKNELEIRIVRILLSAVALLGALCLLQPGIFSHSPAAAGILPELLIGLAALLLIVHLHLAFQRKLLGEVSTALMAASSYIGRLEQFSFLDPQTEVFHRRYLDPLFDQQLKWLNRTGQPATLLLFEVTSDGQKLSSEEVVIAAARVLRSNFRGSDYVVRHSAHRFLVLLPDTPQSAAHYALHRLAEKVDHWNIESKMSGMLLRHQVSTCLPGGSLWGSLQEAEERLGNLQTDPAPQDLPLQQLSVPSQLN